MFSAIRHAATLLPEHRPDWRKHFVSRLQRATGGRAAFTRPGSPPSVGPATCKVSLNSPRNRKFSYISCYERNHHNLQHSCQRKSCIVGNVGARLCKEEECVENKRWCLCIDFDPVFFLFFFFELFIMSLVLAELMINVCKKLLWSLRTIQSSFQ